MVAVVVKCCGGGRGCMRGGGVVVGVGAGRFISRRFLVYNFYFPPAHAVDKDQWLLQVSNRSKIAQMFYNETGESSWRFGSIVNLYFFTISQLFPPAQSIIADREYHGPAGEIITVKKVLKSFIFC
jgi:hypothetical protein